MAFDTRPVLICRDEAGPSNNEVRHAEVPAGKTAFGPMSIRIFLEDVTEL